MEERKPKLYAVMQLIVFIAFLGSTLLLVPVLLLAVSVHESGDYWGFSGLVLIMGIYAGIFWIATVIINLFLLWGNYHFWKK